MSTTKPKTPLAQLAGAAYVRASHDATTWFNVDAEAIRRAVNSHADMLEALEAIEELATRQIQGETPEQCHAQLAQLRGLIHRTAQAAIAKGGAA